MSSNYKSSEDPTNAVNLLISILIRYPEVSTINFDSHRKKLKFHFLFTQILKEDELAALFELLKNSIEVYNILKEEKVKIVQITNQMIADFTMIKIERDVDTLTQGEIALIIQCLKQFIDQDITLDDEEEVIYELEDLQRQEELIAAMLENVKYYQEDKSLFAFREEGRVFVFNK
ncbi:MAG: hypothetical protein LRZ99_02630 [Desulfotomaculum sp.]|nr:hypothetical protein [Desulfotomaculum sp.]MCL0081177.1 hypothetical protein [Peptococcaceae bacterium]